MTDFSAQNPSNSENLDRKSLEKVLNKLFQDIKDIVTPYNEVIDLAKKVEVIYSSIVELSKKYQEYSLKNEKTMDNNNKTLTNIQNRSIISDVLALIALILAVIAVITMFEQRFEIVNPLVISSVFILMIQHFFKNVDRFSLLEQRIDRIYDVVIKEK